MAPFYEYMRDDGSCFETKQRMNEEPLHICPETGQGCRRLITGGHGPLLPLDSTVKYRDGRFVNSKLAKALDGNPLYTSLNSKRSEIKKLSENNKQKNAEMERKITGRIKEL